MNVAETETEDQAVKRYMRAVVQSGVLNKVRAELSEVLFTASLHFHTCGGFLATG